MHFNSCGFGSDCGDGYLRPEEVVSLLHDLLFDFKERRTGFAPHLGGGVVFEHDFNARQD